jgi:hypothetical protein
MIGPEWKMEQNEAQEIAKASAAVLRHHNIQATQKTIDYAALGMILATSYGSRVVAMQMRWSAEHRQRPPAQSPAGANGAAAPFTNFTPTRDPIADPPVH